MNMYIHQMTVMYLLLVYYKDSKYIKNTCSGRSSGLPYFMFFQRYFWILPYQLKLRKYFVIWSVRSVLQTYRSTPISLKPVYMAIRVNKGWIPMCFPTILGSSNCLIIVIISHNTKTAIANFILPLNARKIAHGTITVPEPKIGSASTKPINKAIIKIGRASCRERV